MRVWAGVMVAVLLSLTQAAGAVSLGDGVLGHLPGRWRITGTTRGHATVSEAEVHKEFGGAFIALHIHDPGGANPYQAGIFFGDAGGGALVVHWLDATGGATSQTLGRGQVERDGAAFTFAYPDGVFRDRLTYDPARDRWRLLIVTGEGPGAPVFADWTLTRIGPAGGPAP